MKMLLVALAFCMMVVASARTQDQKESDKQQQSSPVSTKIVPGSKVYIAPMNGFENYLAAAFAKKKVQLVPIADEDQADYVITGTSQDKKAGWAKIVFQGNIHSDAAA